jgi:hypothetical protein
MTDPNNAFDEAAKEDKGKGYGGPAPRKPRNPLFRPNKELAGLADAKRAVPADLFEPLCPNCRDEGCEYCDTVRDTSLTYEERQRGIEPEGNDEPDSSEDIDCPF